MVKEISGREKLGEAEGIADFQIGEHIDCIDTQESWRNAEVLTKKVVLQYIYIYIYKSMCFRHIMENGGLEYILQDFQMNSMSGSKLLPLVYSDNVSSYIIMKYIYIYI